MKKQGFWISLALIALVIVVINILILINYTTSDKVGNTKYIPAAKAGILAIQTDKLTYEKGEMVKITIANNAERAVAEQGDSKISIRTMGNLGQNYGVGLIEYWDDNIWRAIEPVWRCDEACNLPCGELRQINPLETSVFLWPQTRLICRGQLGDANIRQVPSGKFRVTSALWNDERGDYEQMYSNEFWIK